MIEDEKLLFIKRVADENRFGQWADHKARVEAALKYMPFSDVESWRVAAQAFSPVNESPHELTFTPREREAAELVRREVSDPVYQPLLPAAEVPVEQAAEPTYSAPTTPPPVETKQEESKGTDRWHKQWTALAKKVDRTRKADAYDEINWVLQNTLVPLMDILPVDVPSMGALAMLKWVKAHDSNLGKFMQTIYTKTIPDKKQVEFGARFKDDGRKQFQMLDQFMESLYEDETTEAA